MEFLSPRRGQPGRLGILPGSFNPPTLAHLALAEAALAEVDEVLLVLPRVFPHKNYEGASFTQRADMLRALLEHRPRLAAAASLGGRDFAWRAGNLALGPPLGTSFRRLAALPAILPRKHTDPLPG